MEKTSRLTSLFSAAVLASGLGLCTDFAFAGGDRGHHRMDRGHLTQAPRLNRGLHPETLLYGGGYRRGYDSGYYNRGWPRHNHSHGNDFNPWPWVAGAAILGITPHLIPPRSIIVERPLVYSAPYTPPYNNYGNERPFKQYAQVCFEGECTPQTGEILINGKNCVETRRGRTEFAVCQDGSMFSRHID